MNRFRAAFYEEAGEHLENMEGALLQLESASDDPELLNTIFRAAHSIKGASSTFGIEQVARFTHVLENLLDRLREGEVIVTSELIQLLLNSTDVLSALIDAEKNESAPPENIDMILDALHKCTGEPESAKSGVVDGTPQSETASDGEEVVSYEVTFLPSESFFLFGQNPLYLLADLKSLSNEFQAVPNVSKLPAIEELDPEKCYISWTIHLTTAQPEDAVHDVFMFVDDATSYEVKRLTAPAPPESKQAVQSDMPAESAPGEDPENEVKQSVDSPAADAQEEAKAPERRQADRRSGDERRNEGVSVATSSISRETVRVDRERLDKMINQIGELVIGTSMVEQDWMRHHADLESPALVQLGKIVRDLQEMSLSLRMVPIAASFQKMTRIIRDLSLRLGKQVRLETEGEETELDKTVVDQIGDPLLHMVRNSVDHGIETVEERLAAGKSAEGLICLKAYHQGGNFIIEIQDDGRGLDRDKILQKAIDREIVSESDVLSDEEVYGLIFAPGFSTAEQVTDVSGRGVGMDVVRRNVEALQGSISIRSVKGQGCRMIVRLPLTLAILDGLLVQVGVNSYVIPLLSVVESIKPDPDEIRSVLGRGEVITLRGEVVPLMRLNRILNMPTGGEPEDENLLVIVEDQGRKYALVVHELLGQQQVVIKNLEANFQKVPGVAGATILGDGRVALILDINGLCGLVGRTSGISDSTGVV
ncbi:MAG: chemotaxis protein CheA [Planctomycetaceae bacterium]